MINLIVNNTRLDNIDLIIFDKDGTLFEFYPYWSSIINKRSEILCEKLKIDSELLQDHISYLMGIDIKNRRVRKDSPVGNKTKSEIQSILYHDLKKELYSIKKEMVVDTFIETDNFFSNNRQLKNILTQVPGLIDLLYQLNNKCSCAVFSHDHTPNITKNLHATGLTSYFSMILGGEQLKYPKPDPWGALKIMSDLNISDHNTLIIGDSVYDIECGCKAGCKYIITRESEISVLSKQNPISDVIIKDYTNIKVM